MTSEMILSLVVLYLVLGLIFLYIIYRRFYHRSKQLENKYFLYKVRDDLIMLVGKGLLDEEEFLFRKIYPMVNSLINQINSFKFRQVMNAISSQEELVKAGEFSDQLWRELKNKPAPVRKVFSELYAAIGFIIYRNSLLFRILYRTFSTFAFLRRCIESPITLFRSLEYQSKALEYYSFCDSVKVSK